MARTPISRIYPYRDAQLIQFADSLCNSAERDATQLQAYGVSATNIATIRSAREAFANYPTDQELYGDLLHTGQERDTQASLLAQALRQICTRAQLAYGSSSSAYRLYHLGPISALSAQELIRASHYICPLAQQQLAQLAPQGLTATIIADTQAIATTLDTLLDTEFSIQQQRQAATHHRIELGNALYILLIPISEKGKLCWAYTNEARYNDYLLVPSQP